MNSIPEARRPTRDDLLRRACLAVFPCRADKRPATPHGFKDAVSDIAAADALWRRYPGPLIGVATGTISNLAVLDIDPDGRAWWEANAGRLPATKMIRTRRGGLHLWYQQAPGLKCSAGQIATGIDVRADGGYAIAWVCAGLPVLREGPLAPWPRWVTLRGRTGERATAAQGGPEPARQPTDRILIGLTRVLVEAPEGQRNARLFWAGCRMAGLIRGGYAREDGLALLVRAAQIAGLDEDEARRTAEGALATGCAP